MISLSTGKRAPAWRACQSSSLQQGKEEETGRREMENGRRISQTMKITKTREDELA